MLERSKPPCSGGLHWLSFSSESSGFLGLPRDFRVYYILFSFVCSLVDVEQIGCEMFINGSLLDCRFIAVVVSFTDASAGGSVRTGLWIHSPPR